MAGMKMLARAEPDDSDVRDVKNLGSLNRDPCVEVYIIPWYHINHRLLSSRYYDEVEPSICWDQGELMT
jgi:hypothetical protein